MARVLRPPRRFARPKSAGCGSSLITGDCEILVTTTNASNQCRYCVVAHGAILRTQALQPMRQSARQPLNQRETHRIRQGAQGDMLTLY